MLRKLVTVIVIIFVFIWVSSDPHAAGTSVHDWITAAFSFMHSVGGH
jgi:hypothetical protein